MPETAHRKQTRSGWFGLNCNMVRKSFVVRAGETGRHAEGIRKAQTTGEMVSKTVKGRSDPDQDQIRDLKTAVPGDFALQVLEEDLGSRKQTPQMLRIGPSNVNVQHSRGA